MKYERFTEKKINGTVCFDCRKCSKKTKCDGHCKEEALKKLCELEDKLENGTLMEINKPFIKKTKYGSYIICKATVIWVDDFDTKAEAEKKLKELQWE